jgi:hypothetical protein
MYNRKKNNGFGSRTIFSNTVEVKYNPLKKFAATMEVDGETKLVTTEGTVRSQVVAEFHSIAKSVGAKYDGKIYPVNK